MGRKSMMSPHYGFVHDELEFPSESATQVKLRNINGTFVIEFPDGSLRTVSDGVSEQYVIDKYLDTTADYYKQFKTFTERFTTEGQIDTTASLEENYDATNDWYQARAYELDYIDADRSSAYTTAYAGAGTLTMSDDTANAKYNAHSLKIALTVADTDADAVISAAPVAGANLDLSGVNTVYFWARCSEIQTLTDRKVTVALYDGTATAEIESGLCTFTAADTWYRFSIDLSSVDDTLKGDIDEIRVKIATGFTAGESIIIDYITCDKGTPFKLVSDPTDAVMINQLNNLSNAMTVYAFVSEDTTNAQITFAEEAKMMISRDAYTTNTEISIGEWKYVGAYASGKKLYCAMVDISAQPEDADLAYVIEGRGHDFGDYLNVEGLVFTW